MTGITARGYFASPQLLFEKRKNEQAEALTIHFEKVDLASRAFYDEPWRPVVKSGKLVNIEWLEDFRLLAGGDGLPDLYDKLKLRPANFKRRMELLERWGLIFPLETFPALFAALK